MKKNKTVQGHDREIRFVQEYLKDPKRKGGPAAIRAGYSEKGASVVANRLLKKIKVRKLIDQASQKLQEKTEVTVDRLVKGLLCIAESDIRKCFLPDGTLKPIDQLPDDVAAAISGIDSDDLFDGFGRDRKRIGTTKKVRLSDKVRAYEMIARLLGMIESKHSITGAHGKPLIPPPSPLLKDIDWKKFDDETLLAIIRGSESPDPSNGNDGTT